MTLVKDVVMINKFSKVLLPIVNCIYLHKGKCLSIADEVMSLDQSELKIILENHILKKKFGLGQLYNGQQLETIGGKTLRVFIYRTVSQHPQRPPQKWEL